MSFGQFIWSLRVWFRRAVCLNMTMPTITITFPDSRSMFHALNQITMETTPLSSGARPETLHSQDQEWYGVPVKFTYEGEHR